MNYLYLSKFKLFYFYPLIGTAQLAVFLDLFRRNRLIHNSYIKFNLNPYIGKFITRLNVRVKNNESKFMRKFLFLKRNLRQTNLMSQTWIFFYLSIFRLKRRIGRVIFPRVRTAGVSNLRTPNSQVSLTFKKTTIKTTICISYCHLPLINYINLNAGSVVFQSSRALILKPVSRFLVAGFSAVRFTYLNLIINSFKYANTGSRKLVIKTMLFYKIYFYNRYSLPFILPIWGFTLLYQIRRNSTWRSSSFSAFPSVYRVELFIIKRYSRYLNFSTVRLRRGLNYTNLLQNTLLKGTNSYTAGTQFAQPSNISDWTAIERNFNSSTPTFVKLNRVKFKPGYRRIWKKARTEFQKLWGLRFRYQKKLTRYLLQFTKVSGFILLLKLEFELQNILFRARYVPEFSNTIGLINNNQVYVNGILCSFKRFQLIAGDVIQLIVSWKFYISYRWFINWSLQARLKLKGAANRLYQTYKHAPNKMRSRRLPKWVYYQLMLIEDIPNFIEVDFLTLSLIILYEPINISEYNKFNFNFLNLNSIKMYNWKYIV